MKIRQIILHTLCCVFLCGLISAQSINTFDENGRTPLMNAISQSNLEEVRALIAKGADVNLHEQNGLKGSPLMYASSIGNVDICSQLLANGANINAVDINNDHALNWATFSGKVKTAAFLLNKGADVTVKSKHGDAADVAFRLWHGDSISNLFKATKLASKISFKQSAMVKAAENNKIEDVKLLLKEGVSPNTKDELGIPILQIAADKGFLVIVKLLIDENADVNILNRVGQTPLSWAARNAHADIVKLLIEAGAKVDHSGEEYLLTPLIAAAIKGDSEIGKLLLDAGANIEHTDIINNAAALHWALFYGNEDFVIFLIENGANYKRKVLPESNYSASDLLKAYKMKNVQNFIKTQEQVLRIKGSYKVKAIHYIYPDTTYKVNALDYGRFIFSKDKYALQYNPMMSKRESFKNLSKPENEEIIRAFRSVVFNSGSYTLENDIIHTIPDIAKVPGFENGHQYYRMAFEDDTLISLTMFDETYPSGKKPEWYGKLEVKFILHKE